MSSTNLNVQGYPTGGSKAHGIQGPTVYLPVIVGGRNFDKFHYARASLVYADGREVDQVRYPLSQQCATGNLEFNSQNESSGWQVFSFGQLFIRKSGDFCIKIDVMRDEGEAHVNVDTYIGAAFHVS